MGEFMIRSIVPLMGIVVVAWLLIIVESYIFFEVIVPFAPPIHVVGAFTVLAMIKIALTFSLGIVWFIIMLLLQNLYIRSKTKSQTPIPSS